jgi:hypothetical protein
MHKIILLSNNQFCVQRPDGTRTGWANYSEPLFFKTGNAKCVALTDYFGDQAGVHSLCYVVSQTEDESDKAHELAPAGN